MCLGENKKTSLRARLRFNKTHSLPLIPHFKPVYIGHKNSHFQIKMSHKVGGQKSIKALRIFQIRISLHNRQPF